MKAIIKYIVRYQNNFTSAFLFKNNLADLVERGFNLQSLLNSKVLTYEFEFEGWPSIHTNPEESIRPFNNNLFNIRSMYSSVYPGEKFEEPDFEGKDISKKIYKIRYSVNLLPMMGRHK